jgi:YfiH family protein
VWTWLHQVHGARVVVVDEPGAHAGEDGDAVVVTVPGAVAAIQTADCAPVALAAEGAVAMAHVGWRGLLGGVLEATVAALRARGGRQIVATVGPSIGPECYEFGAAELDLVAVRYGDAVRGETTGGRPALDVFAGVRAALAALDVPLPTGGRPPCTAGDVDHYFSHRARAEVERMATVAYLIP